jgi:hypothetical protein
MGQGRSQRTGRAQISRLGNMGEPRRKVDEDLSAIDDRAKSVPVSKPAAEVGLKDVVRQDERGEVVLSPDQPTTPGLEARPAAAGSWCSVTTIMGPERNLPITRYIVGIEEQVGRCENTRGRMGNNRIVVQK